MADRRIPSSSSRRSHLSEASTSRDGGGLRARDVASLQAELNGTSSTGNAHIYDYGMDQRTRRRLSSHSNTSAYRPAVMDRQLSSGSGQIGAVGGAGGPAQDDEAARRRKAGKRRASSNASKTSTVLSGSRAQQYSRDNSRPATSPSFLLFSPPTATASAKSPVSMELPLHDSPLRRWCRLVEKTARKNTRKEKAKEWAVALAVIVWIKWAVGLGGWSGKGHPPLYGDMEAQRHWLSLVTHLPVSQWYHHNLDYWGLDYPPLTAYHSLLLAKIARWTGNAQVVELRGRLNGREIVHGEEQGVLFMRSTVIAGDLVLWALPIALWCASSLGRWRNAESGASKRSSRTLILSFYTIMLQPGLILIDSGHFQYNSIMLGLTLLSVICMSRGYDALGAVCFVLSMGFKQMAIYYAPAIFAYLLGKCIWLGGSEGLNLFTSLGFFSTLTLALLFSPFLYPPSQLFQSLHRIFPFARGLFEDKVANVWCSLNVVIKLRELVSTPTLVRISGLLTLSASLPLVAGIVWVSYSLRITSSSPSPDNGTPTRLSGRMPAPTIKLLPHALFASAMAFFLFSFQVHEKTILLPLMPLTLLIAGKQPGLPGQDFEWAVLLNNIGSFSMYPLLKRDGLALPTIALTLFWNFALGYNPFSLAPSSVKYLSLAAYFGAFLVLFLKTFTVPPPHLPDVFVVMNVVMSCGVFGLAWLWSLTRLVEESWALVGLGFGSGVDSRVTSPGQLYSATRSPNSADLAMLDASFEGGGRHGGRSASVASSSRTATKRSHKSPLQSPSEVPEDVNDFLAPSSYLYERRPEHPRAASSSSSAAGRESSIRLGDLSTHVSPSKTIVPEQRAGYPYPPFDHRAANDSDRYRQSSMSDFQ